MTNIHQLPLGISGADLSKHTAFKLHALTCLYFTPLQNELYRTSENADFLHLLKILYRKLYSISDHIPKRQSCLDLEDSADDMGLRSILEQALVR